MMLSAAACALLGSSAVAAAAADAYQRVVDEAAPGYEILRSEDMLQDEAALRKFLPADEIAKRKKRRSPGLVVGRFNEDAFLDFAALVVNRSLKGEGPERKGHFAARLVVCLGTNASHQYRCEILPTLHGNEIRLPYWADLELLKMKGEIQCGPPGGATRAYYPEGWQGRRPSGGERDLPALKLRLKHDAIGEYAIGSNLGRTLVRRPDGVYVDCANAD